MARQKALEVRVGDVVLIDMGHYPSGSLKRNFQAYVTAVHERLESTPLITYKRLDGFADDFSNCAVGFVVKVVERARYVCVPRARVNIFTDDSWSTRRYGGLMYGPFTSLVEKALSTVTHVDLRFPVDEERARALWLHASSPGSTARKASSDDYWAAFYCASTVRWKAFKRWVHQNAPRLIESKREATMRARELHRKWNEDAMDAWMVSDEADREELEEADQGSDYTDDYRL